jgi:hypothetical protein
VFVIVMGIVVSRLGVRVIAGFVVRTGMLLAAGLLMTVLARFLPARTIGVDGCGFGVTGPVEKLRQAVLTAKIKRLPIALGVKSGRFVHGHSADRVFDDGFRLFHGSFLPL